MIRRRNDTNEVDIFLFHGWGLVPGIWSRLISSIENGIIDSESPAFHLHDRGYFGEEDKTDLIPGGGSNIIITHSLGLHFVPLSLLHKTDMIFVISGFRDFHKTGGDLSNRIVERMISQLRKDPEVVLKDFYRNMFLPESVPDNFMYEMMPNIRLDRLERDLQILNENILSEKIFTENCRINLIHGDGDIIAPAEHSKGWMRKMNNVSGTIMLNGGHAIPITHHEEIAHQIVQKLFNRV